MNSRKTRMISMIGVFFFVVSAGADSIPVLNHSFEDPNVAPVEPYAYPLVTDWIEVDNDTDYSSNTGVFLNVTGIVDTDANQLAFLGSQTGNALLQDLPAHYQAGKYYKMIVGVCVSGKYQPPDPNGLQLAFYYTKQNDPNLFDVAVAETSPPSFFDSNSLVDQSVIVTTVQEEDPWAGRPIGIAIRATGPIGGYWDLDNVRVVEYPLTPNFTDDFIVNLADFALMSKQWLLCGDLVTDVTGDKCVDVADILVITEYWLSDI